MPSSGIPIGLTRTLKVRTEYFFRPEPVALEGIEYRKRSSLPNGHGKYATPDYATILAGILPSGQ